MIFDVGVITGAAGCALSVASLVLARIYHSGAVRAAARAREEWEIGHAHQGTRIEALNRQVDALEISRENSDEILREDRLNQSGRARALQVLRSGMSADSAAASLGMPRREMRLLAKVSRLICAYR